MASGGRLIDIENEIKALIVDDPSMQNPLIFEKIYDLIRLWFLRTKKITDYSILDDVAYTGAEMLFMKVYTGGHIHSWLGYISLAYQSFIREYKKLTSGEIFDVEANGDLFDTINEVSTRLSNNTTELSEFMDKSVLDNLMTMVDRFMEESKYIPYTVNYVDARLSLSLMILTGDPSCYLIDESERGYIRFLYNVFKEKVKLYMCKTIDVESILNSSNSMVNNHIDSEDM